MSSRSRKKRSSYSDDDSDEDDDSFNDNDASSSSDDEFGYGGRQTRKREVVRKPRTISRSTSKPSMNTKSEEPRQKKQKIVAPKPIRIAPADLSTTKSLELDPNGKECRFIPYEKIKDIILMPDRYLKTDELGVNTIIPHFDPSDPRHLGYFGFKSEIEKTELSTIAAMTDEELMEAIERIEEDIVNLPEMDRVKKGENPPVIAIPGYPTNLTDSVAIQADVRTFDWARLGRTQKFDVILMDPPWVIAKTSITRGVNIIYDQLDEDVIASMPLDLVQDNGYIFMWVIASQFHNGVTMMKKWGYKVVSYLNWIKISRYGKYMPSHGYYMQHNKETLFIGVKGTPPEEMDVAAFESCLIQPREVRQSHKPADLYETIEKIFPGGMYLEVFARPHNLRSGWVSLGIELPT